MNAFEQQSFMRQKKQTDTFWDDDDVHPFRLSMPEHFKPPASNIFQQKQKNVLNINNSTTIHRNNRHTSKQRKREAIPNPRSFANRQSESYIYNRPHSTLVNYFVQKIYSNWIEKELYFSMSKLSFLVLIIGLFFLSSLLFITGFLVAVNIYDIHAPNYSQTSPASLPSSVTNIPSHLPTVPAITMPNSSSLPSLAHAPAAPNPNIIRSGTHGGRMADIPIIDTAHMPSIYAQLPTQSLPPAPLPMPQNGGHYIAHQQAPVALHTPSSLELQQQASQQQKPAHIQAQQPHVVPQHSTSQPYPQQAYPQHPPQMYPPQGYHQQAYPPQYYPPSPSPHYQPQPGTH